MARVKRLILEVILLLSLLLELTAVVSIGPRTLQIFNNVQPADKLTVHCKSGDEDVGEVEVKYGEAYEFKFNPNVWGTTLYFCRITWRYKTLSFDAYRHSRDFTTCDLYCVWSVTIDGPYFFDARKRIWVLRYKW
ncbi:hypothetical protein SLA2020_064570 [Shorea laevis]